MDGISENLTNSNERCTMHTMKHNTQTVRLSKDTVKLLKLIGAITEETQGQVTKRLALTEWERVQKEQKLNGWQNIKRKE